MIINSIKRRVAVFSASALAGAAFLAAAGTASAFTTLLATLGPGDSGSSVSDLQSFLALDSSVYPEGLVTGYYGSLTTAAVQRFQCKYAIVCEGDANSTGYGRVGPLTLAEIRSREGAVQNAPIGAPGIPNTDGSPDESAPILGEPIVSAGSASVTVAWSSSEPAQNSVLYGTAWPFYYGSAPSASLNGLTATPTVTITGLQPNTTYYYVLQSVDASGNLQYGIGNRLRTNP